MADVSTVDALAKIDCRPFTIESIRSDSVRFDELRFWIFFEVPDRDNPAVLTEVGRHGILPLHADEQYIIGTVRMMMHRLVTHEVDEFFLYDGDPIFDPHDHKDRC